MNKPRTGFILFGITAALCLTIFVYFDKRERNLVNMITLQDHAASDTHDPYICRKNEELEHKIHKGRNMDDDEKWNNDQSASEKYSRNVLVDKLQLPLKGQTFNPVVRGFLEQLKRKGDMAKDVEIENIGQYGKYHLQLRDTDLNAKELKNTGIVASVCRIKPKDCLNSYLVRQDNGNLIYKDNVIEGSQI